MSFGHRLLLILISFISFNSCYLVLSYKSEAYYNLVHVGSTSDEVVSELCRNELKQIQNGIDNREIWAMKSECVTKKFINKNFL